MYPFILGLHNLFRWVALVLAIVATVGAFLGWFGKRQWSKRDRKIGSFFGIAMDIQLLLGLILYFVYSPITRQALADLGAAMGVKDLRFFGVEHVFYMVHWRWYSVRYHSTSTQRDISRGILSHRANLNMVGPPWPL